MIPVHVIKILRTKLQYELSQFAIYIWGIVDMTFKLLKV